MSWENDTGDPGRDDLYRGGTPSVPDSGLIVEIMEHVRHAFHVADGAEISMEANPGTVTREKLRITGKLGSTG